jgi:hypothetical protein
MSYLPHIHVSPELIVGHCVQMKVKVDLDNRCYIKVLGAIA